MPTEISRLFLATDLVSVAKAAPTLARSPQTPWKHKCSCQSLSNTMDLQQSGKCFFTIVVGIVKLHKDVLELKTALT